MIEKTDETPVVAQPEQQLNVQEITAQATKAAREQLEADFQAKLEEAENRATARAREEIAEKLVGKKEEEKWIPKDWEEVKEASAREAEARFETKMKAEREAEQKQKSAFEEEKKTKEADLHKYWDSQVASMTEGGLLPALEPEVAQKLTKGEALSAEERELPAVKARQEIYKLAQEHKEPNLELVYYKHYANRQQPNIPPVLGSAKSVNSNEKPAFTYEEIHKSSLEDLVKGSV